MSKDKKYLYVDVGIDEYEYSGFNDLENVAMYSAYYLDENDCKIIEIEKWVKVEPIF